MEAKIRSAKMKAGDLGAIPIKYVRKDGRILNIPDSNRSIVEMINDKYNKQRPDLKASPIIERFDGS